MWKRYLSHKQRLRQACKFVQSHQSLRCTVTLYRSLVEASGRVGYMVPLDGYKSHKPHDAKNLFLIKGLNCGTGVFVCSNITYQCDSILKLCLSLLQQLLQLISLLLLLCQLFLGTTGKSRNTITILSFRTNRSGQTVYRSSLIRVYTVCHSVCIFWMHYSIVKPPHSNFRVITSKFFGYPNFYGNHSMT